jgi:hypothetical protein
VTTPAASQVFANVDVASEFDRQLATIRRLGYAEIAGTSAQSLAAAASALLADVLARIGPTVVTATPASAPFVLVVPARLVPAAQSMPLTSLGGRPGFISRDTADIATFSPIPGLAIPPRTIYALLDVRRGEEFCNVRPKDALVAIREAGRSPLTYDEGIALLIHNPASLEKNKCFSLSGSRCGDKRVPALWISDRRPKLGWCWDGNPHTWLGSAHTGGRC